MLRKILCFVCRVVATISVWAVFCVAADYILELKADPWRMLWGWVGGSLAVWLGYKAEQLFVGAKPTTFESCLADYERGYSAGKKDEENNGGWEREPFKYG